MKIIFCSNDIRGTSLPCKMGYKADIVLVILELRIIQYWISIHWQNKTLYSMNKWCPSILILHVNYIPTHLSMRVTGAWNILFQDLIHIYHVISHNHNPSSLAFMLLSLLLLLIGLSMTSQGRRGWGTQDFANSILELWALTFLTCQRLDHYLI